MGAHTWDCPACGRSVPLRVSACHCGMTRERAEARTEALAAASAAGPAPRTARRPIRGPRLTWSGLPGDVKALVAGFVLVALAGIAWLGLAPRPDPIVPVLGYVDAGSPPAPRPTPRPTPAFKLPWWK